MNLAMDACLWCAEGFAKFRSMQLALILSIGVLFVICVQSQAPDRCLRSIDSLFSRLQAAASELDAAAEENESLEGLHMHVSEMAQTIQELSDQKRNVMRGSASVGTRKGCLQAINSLYKKLQQTARKLQHIQGDDEALIAAGSHVNAALELVKQMKRQREAHV